MSCWRLALPGEQSSLTGEGREGGIFRTPPPPPQKTISHASSGFVRRLTLFVTHPRRREDAAGSEQRQGAHLDALTSPNLWLHFLVWRLLWEISTALLKWRNSDSNSGEKEEATCEKEDAAQQAFLQACGHGNSRPVSDRTKAVTGWEGGRGGWWWKYFQTAKPSGAAAAAAAADTTELSRCCS